MHSYIANGYGAGALVFVICLYTPGGPAFDQCRVSEETAIILQALGDPPKRQREWADACIIRSVQGLILINFIDP